MGFADNLRNEISNNKEQIIATRFQPRRDEIMDILATGIKRLGYVQIDTSGYRTGTYEGTQIGAKREELNALAEWLRKEGFIVEPMWWGYDSAGMPDMLRIRV